MRFRFTLGSQKRFWRAILIRDDADVDHLNVLLSKGWDLELIELEGLPFLALPIAPEDFGAPCDNPGANRPAGRHPDALPLVLILTRRGKRRRQRGMVMTPDVQGYFDLAELDQRLRGYEGTVHGHAFFRMANGNRFVLVDWGEHP